MTIGKDLIPVGALELEGLDPSIAEYVLSAVSENTKRAYQSDLRQFLDWGGTIPASDRMIARYLVDHATKHAIRDLGAAARRDRQSAQASGIAVADVLPAREADFCRGSA